MWYQCRGAFYRVGVAIKADFLREITTSRVDIYLKWEWQFEKRHTLDSFDSSSAKPNNNIHKVY